MATMHQQPAVARSWNPNFNHSDRERWICIYPAYINSKKSLVEGRKIPKDKCVDNPTYSEIKDVCAAAGMVLGVENKVYPRERDVKDAKFRGRIRVQLKSDDGTPMLEPFPNRKAVLYYLGDTIPKLKARMQSHSTQQSSQQQQAGKKKKGRKK